MQNNKIALVTGASRGIGKTIALTLGKSGISVVGSATTEAGAKQISDYLESAGIKGFGVVLDLSNQETIENALATIKSKLGEPNILVNNAGRTKDNLFLRMSQEDWDATIDANLSGVFRITKACIKPMVKARWGRIVNLSSVVAIMGNAGQTNYSAAKAGVIAFSKSLAQELASRGITVNAVAPGFIDTDMTKALGDDARDVLVKQIPAKRIGNPEDIAHAVAFLVSDNASYITGETVNVNGGMLMD